MKKKKTNYPDERKKAKQTKCSVCQKMVFERGYKSHLRLAHKLKLTEITQITKEVTQVIEPVITQVRNGGEITQVIEPMVIRSITYEQPTINAPAVISEKEQRAREEYIKIQGEAKELCPSCGKPAFKTDICYLNNINGTSDSTDIPMCPGCRDSVIKNHYGYSNYSSKLRNKIT